MKDGQDGNVFVEEVYQDRLFAAERAKYATSALKRICTVVPVEITEITEEEGK